MKNFKLIGIIFTVLMLLLLAACSSPKSTPVLTPPVVTTPFENPSKPSDAQPSATPASSNNAAVDQTEIKLYLNGNKLDLSTPPLLVDGKVMVPISQICGFFSRSITCTMQGSVLTIVDENKNTTIEITAGDAKAKVNRKEVPLQAKSIQTNEGEILVDLTAFNTLLNADTKFNEEFSSAYITESGLC